MSVVKRQALLLSVVVVTAVAAGRMALLARVDTMRKDPELGAALETAVITAVLLGAAIWIGAKVTTAVHAHGSAIK